MSNVEEWSGWAGLKGTADRGNLRTLTGRSLVEQGDWRIRNTAEEVLSHIIWQVEYFAQPHLRLGETYGIGVTFQG